MANLKQILKKNNLKEHRVHFGMFDFSFNCVVGKYENIIPYLAYKWELDKEQVKKWNEDLDLGYTPRGRWWKYQDYSPIIWIPKKP